MKTKPRSREEVQAALDKLSGEYDYYCGVTSRKAKESAVESLAALEAYRREDLRTTTEFRSKIKALYWVLGEEEL